MKRQTRVRTSTFPTPIVKLMSHEGPIYSNMPSAYEIRAGGDVKNKKQSMAELKLRRLNELNMRLREDLDRPRIRVSEAAMGCVYCLAFVACASMLMFEATDTYEG